MAAPEAAGLKELSHVVVLTAREHEILQLRQQGMSNKEVATALRLEVQTVKNHMRNLSLKLQLAHWYTPSREPEPAAQEV
jgi:ATP/maltotriose-dependent transcriptional regulator MalT